MDPRAAAEMVGTQRRKLWEMSCGVEQNPRPTTNDVILICPAFGKGWPVWGVALVSTCAYVVLEDFDSVMEVSLSKLSSDIRTLVTSLVEKWVDHGRRKMHLTRFINNVIDVRSMNWDLSTLNNSDKNCLPDPRNCNVLPSLQPVAPGIITLLATVCVNVVVEK